MEQKNREIEDQILRFIYHSYGPIITPEELTGMLIAEHGTEESIVELINNIVKEWSEGDTTRVNKWAKQLKTEKGDNNIIKTIGEWGRYAEEDTKENLPTI